MFCVEHRKQPLILLYTLVFGVLAGSASIYSSLQEVLTPESSQTGVMPEPIALDTLPMPNIILPDNVIRDSYSIKGIIFDDNTKSPIYGAKVICGSHVVKTSETGSFEINNVATSAQKIVVFTEGYQEYSDIIVPPESDLIILLKKK